MILSNELDKISPAVLSAQKELGGVKKGAANPFFKSKYADLTAVIEALKDVLNNNGLSMVQTQRDGNVMTTLLHSSGQYISSATPIICAKQNDPQALGSAITYARRYGLQSILCLPAEDDDGERAMARKPLKTTSKKGDF